MENKTGNKTGLGRGLGSLLGIFDEENESNEIQMGEDKIEKVLNNEVKNSAGGVVELSLSLVKPNPDQPRKNFDPTALQELSDSIKTHGVIQPIIVNEQPNGQYLIVAGERRFKASKLAGLKTIPAVVKKYTQQQIKEISLLENIQREDLNPIEAAKAMRELLEVYNWTQDVLATRLGKSRPAVTNLLRLLNLQPEVIRLIESGKLSPGHARSLVVVTDPEAQIKLAHMATRKKVTVRDLEKAVKNLQGKKSKSAKASTSLEFLNLLERMQRKFATKVTYLGSENKGKILIEYYSKDDLDRIFDAIKD